MKPIGTALFVFAAFTALALVAGVAETRHFERAIEARR